MPTVNFVITEQQHAKLKEAARATGKSASSIIRDLIDTLPDKPVLLSHDIVGPCFDPQLGADDDRQVAET